MLRSFGRVAVVECAEERSTRHHISYSRFGKLLLGLRISCAFFSDRYYRTYDSGKGNMLWVYGITSTTSGVYHHDTSERRMCGDVFKRPNVRLTESHRMSGCHKLASLRRRLAGWPQPKVFDFSLKVWVCV